MRGSPLELPSLQTLYYTQHILTTLHLTIRERDRDEQHNDGETQQHDQVKRDARALIAEQDAANGVDAVRKGVEQEYGVQPGRYLPCGEDRSP